MVHIFYTDEQLKPPINQFCEPENAAISAIIPGRLMVSTVTDIY
jgi:hypothetical protein